MTSKSECEACDSRAKKGYGPCDEHYGVEPKPQRTDLFEFSTFEPTQRLTDLVAGKIEVTGQDITVLWDVYAESREYTGALLSLQEFATWLKDGANVTW